jgi:hypothetical protein
MTWPSCGLSPGVQYAGGGGWGTEGLGHHHAIPQHDHDVHDIQAGLVGVVGLDMGGESPGIAWEP